MSKAKRINSMEIRAIRDQLKESPPPAPSGSSVREWMAGLALANPVLMQGISVEHRAKEAVRLADELITALAAPKVPSLESMAPPSEAELSAWKGRIDKEKDRLTRQLRDTVPSLKCMHPPAISRRLPEETRYSMIGGGDFKSDTVIEGVRR